MVPGQVDFVSLGLIVLQLISILIIAGGYKSGIHRVTVFGYGFFGVLTIAFVLYNTFS
jgi:hypothetical protein